MSEQDAVAVLAEIDMLNGRRERMEAEETPEHEAMEPAQLEAQEEAAEHAAGEQDED
jgi:hypothetical protein